MITRAEFEKIIVDRIGPWMALANMSTVTDGANGSLDDPIRTALSQMNLTSTDPLVPADADFEQIADQSDLTELADRTTYRVLVAISTRVTFRNVKVDVIQVWDSDRLTHLRELTKIYAAKIEGYDEGGAAAGSDPEAEGMGTINLDTQAIWD